VPSTKEKAPDVMVIYPSELETPTLTFVEVLVFLLVSFRVTDVAASLGINFILWIDAVVNIFIQLSNTKITFCLQ
jgi:hypothetical protein